MTKEKKITVKIAPGAFDSFEGSQEELDELMQTVIEMFQNMTPEELEASSTPVDFDELLDSDDAEDQAMAQALFAAMDSTGAKKTLH